MSETTINKEDVDACADRIGELLSDMSAFSELKAHWPDAGQFTLAQWLERVVDDRRNGVVAHAEHLNKVFGEMRTTLKRIADDFEKTDGDNAEKIKNAITEMESKIGKDVAGFDENTEGSQGNFGGGDDKDNTDGDGYNDDLNTSLSAT